MMTIMTTETAEMTVTTMADHASEQMNCGLYIFYLLYGVPIDN